MKRQTLFLVMCIISILGFNCYSQTVLPTKESKKFTWEESKQGKTFTVAFKYGLDVGNIPQERLNSVIMNAIIKSKYQLKNTLSFRPIEVMVYGDNKELKLVVEYSGKNSYGAESSLKSFFDFKNEGDGDVRLIFTN